jgi:group I intron endonuclease
MPKANISRLKNKIGVYQILNTVNGKMYIGSTATSFKDRWNGHKKALESGKHVNRYLQNAWNKYGAKYFDWYILETCKNKEDCLPREQFWIDHFTPYDRTLGYNIARSVTQNMLGVKHTEESRAKMRISQKGNLNRVKATIAAAIANKGKKRPLHVNEAVRKFQTGRKMDDATKKKISDAHWTKRGGEETEEKIRNMAEKLKESAKTNHWSKRPDAAEIAERIWNTRRQREADKIKQNEAA